MFEGVTDLDVVQCKKYVWDWNESVATKQFQQKMSFSDLKKDLDFLFAI